MADNVMRKVLVTGGGGFLGSHLVDALLKRGDEVFVLDTGPDWHHVAELVRDAYLFVATAKLRRQLDGAPAAAAKSPRRG